MNPFSIFSPSGFNAGSLALSAISTLSIVVGVLYRHLCAQLRDAKDTARRQQSLCEAQNAILAAKVDAQSGAYRKLQDDSRDALMELQRQSNRAQRDLAKAINRLAQHHGTDETTDLPTLDDDSDTYPSKNHQHG